MSSLLAGALTSARGYCDNREGKIVTVCYFIFNYNQIGAYSLNQERILKKKNYTQTKDIWRGVIPLKG